MCALQAESNGLLEKSRSSIVSQVATALRGLFSTRVELEPLCRSWLQNRDAGLSISLAAELSTRRLAACSQLATQLQTGYHTATPAPFSLVPAAFGLWPPSQGGGAGSLVYGGVCLNSELRLVDTPEALGLPFSSLPAVSRKLPGEHKTR